MNQPKRESSGKQGPRLLLMLVALGIAALWFGRRSSGPETGTQAADFQLNVVSGDTGAFRLSEQRGKPVLVEAFASWCGVCKRSAPMLANAARAKRKREVRFVGVSVDESAADARAVAHEWQIPYPVLHDTGQFSRSYNVKLLPTFVLIDEQGKIRHVSAGPPGERELESWLDELGAAKL